MPKKLAVTELAKMGYCETLLVLNKKHGTRTQFDQASINRGNKEHDAFDKLVNREHIVQDKRCFIASAVYGEHAWQTDQLRDWRDRSLASTATGRYLIKLYYACSPSIATLLQRYPALQVPVRSALNLVRRVL